MGELGPEDEEERAASSRPEPAAAPIPEVSIPDSPAFSRRPRAISLEGEPCPIFCEKVAAALRDGDVRCYVSSSRSLCDGRILCVQGACLPCDDIGVCERVL